MRIRTNAAPRMPLLPALHTSLALASFLLPICAAQAQETLTFENAPIQYIHNGGGKQNLGAFYGGVAFGNMQVLDSALGTLPYNASIFPAHSGTAVAGYFSGKTSQLTFPVPVSDVSFYYTVAAGADVTVTDMTLGGLKNTFTLPSDPGSSNLFSFADTGITQLVFQNGAAVLTLDDLSFAPTPPAVPEAASAASLGVGLALLAALCRRSRAKGKSPINLLDKVRATIV